ncbi:hypothetical protein COCVIDRAFT_98346 [Bipolaris victoriae FI3]|uniref:Uncharacterized protein n=2 Tax=Bipolaris TaxID=33194 RepID=W6XJR5_COCC2|nr:uncharacterized protein COCCADRAFT_111806 [Bipolaris zeicola 26-R-13]XP_014556944.1 hypothetical protein COCVIDRAFT_98346 [Bipolaris victoriae FI3]EUC27407.1 hypothetical protein COCCADRAFT_111806 [Bipolaris zeicola 26-R-13]
MEHRPNNRPCVGPPLLPIEAPIYEDRTAEDEPVEMKTWEWYEENEDCRIGSIVSEVLMEEGSDAPEQTYCYCIAKSGLPDWI